MIFPGLFSVQSSANAVWAAEGGKDPHQDQRTKWGKEEISSSRKAIVKKRKRINLKLPKELNLNFQ